MANIGFRIESQNKYEETFKRQLPPGSDKMKPLLSEQEMTQALKELGITLSSEERQELSSFFL